ncbi:odorant receptor 24a [Musca domestica]|uniref:Odorant receptor n=1 Tax=Musca domestica TaxID=7370 RepID=A0A1I8M250_MUSDO|nr:odorant receptor 24a [Musca domestica]
MVPNFLKNSYPLNKQYLLIPRFALRILGFYPESEWNVWLKSWAFFNISILAYGCYAELYYGIYYLPIDIVMSLDALCPVASSIMSFIKIFFIWWYREQYKQLIEEVRRLTEDQNTLRKEKMKRWYFTIATRLTALVLFFGLCCSTSYSIRAILTNTLLYLNGKDIVYETPFKMMFPEPLLAMPIYPITFLLVHWHGYITVLSFVAGDGLFLGFCFYFSTLLKALQQDLTEVLGVIDETKKYRKLTESEKVMSLSKIIRRHNEIADLTMKLSSIMVEITLCHFITSSVIIGTSVIDLLLFAGGYGSIVYIVYTCAVLSEIFLYCLGGTAVIESSQELAVKAYTSNWYGQSVRIQKMVLLIIVRSQRHFVVKVPFFTPSLPALTAILRFTGSVIALVKSMI